MTELGLQLDMHAEGGTNEKAGRLNINNTVTTSGSDRHRREFVSTWHSWNDGIRFHVLKTMTNCKIWREHGETTVGARQSQQWPALFSDWRLIWKQDCRGTQRCWEGCSITCTRQPLLHNVLTTRQLLVNMTNNCYVTQIPKFVLEIPLWPLSFLYNQECVCTHCLILSFWGPNLGPVGPLLENRH